MRSKPGNSRLYFSFCPRFLLQFLLLLPSTLECDLAVKDEITPFFPMYLLVMVLITAAEIKLGREL